jgi:hypothetical protein
MLERKASGWNANPERGQSLKKQHRPQPRQADESDALRASIQNRYYNATPLHGAKARSFRKGKLR